MKERKPTGPYTIVGYSGGCAVAFQMALQLKLEGEVVQDLVFLDGSPSYGHEETSKPYVLELLRSMNSLDRISQQRFKALELTVGDTDILPKTFDVISKEINLDRAQAEVYKKLITELDKHVPYGTYGGDVHVLQAADSISDTSPNNST